MSTSDSALVQPSASDLPPSPSSYTYPGAKWWKMDFHTHTPASADYANRAGPMKQQLKNQTPEDWLKRQMDWGLDALIVTDHNTTDYISKLQLAYNQMDQSLPGYRPLVIFPGFELTVNGGLHLLAVFDPSSDLTNVSGVITACGYRGTRGGSDSVSSESFENCIKLIKENGGLTIGAHVDEACGLLWNKLTTGDAIRQLMHSNDISHDEAVSRLIDQGMLATTVREEAQKVNQTVEAALDAGLDAIEVRDWDRLPLAIQEHSTLARLARVTGSDSHMPRDIGKNGFSMVHMTKPNLEGLRMAFADGSAVKPRGGDPIRESWSVRPISKTDTTDWNIWPDHAIEKINVAQLKTAGRTTALELPLHPKLNVLIGGRGSGKSTFVHALRLATQRGRELPRHEGHLPVKESPAGDFWRWAQIPSNRGEDGVVVRDQSVIKVLYRSPAQQAEIHWQASFLGQGVNSTPPKVLVGSLGTDPTEDGGAYTASRFPLSIYSQKQVLEMSRGPAGLMEIIDREQNVSSLDEQLKEAIASYEASKAKIRELATSLSNEAQDAASLKDILAELEKVQSPSVKEYQRRQAQARILLPNLSPDSALIVLSKELSDQADRLKLQDLAALIVPSEDNEATAALAIYETAQRHLLDIRLQIKSQSQLIETTLKTLDNDLRSSTWWEACKESKLAYQNVLGTQTVAIDPARLTKLNQDRTQLESRLAKHHGTRQEIIRFEAVGREQLVAVQKAREAISESRSLFVRTHNAKGTLLRMNLVPMGAEALDVERSLREALGVDTEKFTASIGAAEGARADSLMRLFTNAGSREAGVSVVRQKVIQLIDSSENAPGFADLQNNLRRQISTTPSRREAIETWFPGDRLELEYRTTESNNWKSISQGSIGQQTAAVLSFLLSFGSEPLVLDQPEDDLDTRMIMSLIVEQVRTMKELRQIIIVTHNPNIVVHGDADLVHAMEDQSGLVHRNIAASGGLQEKATRKFICDVMEGGSIAFRKRFDRMGREEI